MSYNPSLYQINTRVWIKQFDTADHVATLADVPDTYWLDLKEKGMDLVWLMGIWKTCETTAIFGQTPQDLDHYQNILPDFEIDDVVPSPFAVDEYEINPELGTFTDLKHLKLKLNSMGLKLILDFVANHFSRDSHLVDTNPEYFIQGSKEDLAREPGNFFEKNGLIFAHGRDPHYAAWIDSVQVNYFNPSAVEYMQSVLSEIATLCDGIRCDMTMLILNEVFENTWSHQIAQNNCSRPTLEFWDQAIKITKSINPNFTFIAEVYWGLEYKMHTLGFDFTYDKKLYDLLASDQNHDLHNYLYADKSYQQKMVRFIENHDEDRSVEVFGKPKVMSAAVAISTLPGLHFYQDGQWWGSRVHLPMQLSRTSQEQPDESLFAFYSYLLEIVEDVVIKTGDWSLVALTRAEDDFSFENLVAWRWQLGNVFFFVFINYSAHESVSWAKLNFETSKVSLNFVDELNQVTYAREVNELHQKGLFIKLAPYQSHIFRVEI